MKQILILLTLGSSILISCSPKSQQTQVNWVFVEGGSFLQGKHQFILSKGGDTVTSLSHSPRRTVQLNDFYIGAAEVTVKEFKEFCRHTQRQMPDPPSETAYGEPSTYRWQDKYPMLATWSEAEAYAKWVGGRLPTEAEWEYAAMGGQKSKGFTYSGSNVPREVGWVSENADSTFHPVKLLKPNELGLYDMTGNLNEWVSDWYNPEKDYQGNIENPQGPPEPEGKRKMKISKGVGWYYDSEDDNGNPIKIGIHMPELRYQSPIETRNNGFGFRLAKDKE